MHQITTLKQPRLTDLTTLLAIPIFAITFVVLLLGGIKSAAAGTMAYAWGQVLPGSFIGVQTYMSTPNPNLLTLQSTAGPTAATDLTGNYIESGPSKNYNGNQALHPYGSWGVSDVRTMNLDNGVTLGANQFYKYYSQRVSGTTWQSVFCYGTNPQVCHQEVSANIQLSTVPYLISGGESSGSDAHWGSISTGNGTLSTGALLYRSSGSGWENWCYTPPGSTNVNGTVSACNHSTYNWTSSY